MSDAVVKSCIKEKDWTGKDGKAVPIYKVELSDGRIGESFGKEIPSGTAAADISIEDKGQYGLKFKLNKAVNGKAWSGSSKSTNESFALSYAKDIACAHITQGKEFKAEQVIPVAEVFYNWLESKKK